ncbi:MAG: cupin domain-containing protein [Desulfuromonas sp.]|nr:cupin domain-containing protein [Desulfuromonas sp.]
MTTLAQIHTVTDLVDYQADAVVSKTLIKKDAGTVTLFAFGQGQELSTHSAPFDALVYVVDGEVEITISATAHALTQGEMIILPANEPHGLKATKDFKMMLTMIKA